MIKVGKIPFTSNIILYEKTPVTLLLQAQFLALDCALEQRLDNLTLEQHKHE